MDMTKATFTTMLLTALLLSVGGCDSKSDGNDMAAGTGGMATATGGMATATGGVATATGGTAGDDSSPCQVACAVAESLACAGDDAGTCLSQCDTYYNISYCNAEMRAALSCYASVAADNWECSADSQESNVKDGFCDTEDTSLANCLAGT